MSVEAFKAAVKELMADQAAAAQKAGDPNEERFAKIGEALANAQKAGYEPGTRLARLTRAYVQGGETFAGTVETLKKWGSDDMVDAVERHYESHAERSLAFNGPSGAGLLVPEEYSNELIPLLRPYSVLASVALRNVSMAYGTLHFPRISSGSTSYWRPPQGDNKKAGTPTFGRLTLQEKALTCISILPNRLMEVPGNTADQFVLQDMLAGLGTNLDYAHLAGKGDEFEPLGLTNYPTSGTGAITPYAVSAAFDWKLPIKMIEKHITAKGSLVRPAFVGNPALWSLLMTATTGSYSAPVWLQELSMNKTLLGIPFHHSIYVPVAATSNNPTSFILCDYMEYLLGVASNMRISRSTEATVYDSAGAAYHLYPNNDTAIKAIWSGDMGLRQTACCTVGTGIQTT